MTKQVKLENWSEDKEKPRISLYGINGKSGEAVSSISIVNGEVEFIQDCDPYFNIRMSTEQAKQALQEAIQWIDAHSEKAGEPKESKGTIIIKADGEPRYYLECPGCGHKETVNGFSFEVEQFRCPKCEAVYQYSSDKDAVEWV